MAQNEWKVFKSHDDYARGMDRFLQLASGDLIPGTDDFDEFELLNLLIGHFEKKNYQVGTPDPIEAIKFRMDQQGLSQADMTQFIGSTSKVSEVLNRKRPLSLSMIRRLHDGLGIPADILIQDMSAIEWRLLDVIDIGKEITSHKLQCDAEISDCSILKAANYSPKKHVTMAREVKKIRLPPEDTKQFKQMPSLFGIFTTIVSEPLDELQFNRNYSLIS